MTPREKRRFVMSMQRGRRERNGSTKQMSHSIKEARASAIESLERRRLLAAISWDGGGDGVNWHDPINWSGNTLPGLNDDVTINVAANPTIQFTSAAGNVSVRTLNSAEAFNLAGGAL